MGKVSINETTLTNIGDAIREKTGKVDLIAPGDMPDEIRAIVSGGGSDNERPTDEDLTFTGDGQRIFMNGNWDWVIETYGNRITIKDITSAAYMFQGSQVETIPFNLQCNGKQLSLQNVFLNASNLKTLPKILNPKPTETNALFDGCKNIREIPEDYFDTWDWSYIKNLTSSYNGSMSRMFGTCFSLRSIPIEIYENGNPVASYGNTYFSSAFFQCSSLDEVIDLPNPHVGTTYTSNMKMERQCQT